MYQIAKRKGGPKHVRQNLVARDQFGDHALRTIKQAFLLVPTAKTLGSALETSPQSARPTRTARMPAGPATSACRRASKQTS